jgi:nitrous oxidase accessory protein
MAVAVATLVAVPAGAQEAVVVSPEGPVRTVAEGVRRAPAGGRVIVRPGRYREPTVIVDKPVAIVGDGWPELDGEGRRALLEIRADDVTVRGLVLRDVGTSYTEDRAALRVSNARRCTIEGNRIENGFFGIYLASVSGCTVARNEIRGRASTEASSGNAIHLWSSSDVTVEENRISGHRDGIYLEFTRDAVVRDNTSERNVRYGLHFMFSDSCRYIRNVFRDNLAGVAVMYSKRVGMQGNTFADSWGGASYGLLLKEVVDAELEGNRFEHNTVGLLADGANRLVARHNDFTGNGWALRLMASTQGASFTANNFTGNTFDVATNSRQSFSTFHGNYWEAYRGYDVNRDGVGDVPHRPVRLFSLLVAENAPSLILLRSLFVGVLDAAERVLPSLTPAELADDAPAMRRVP